VTHIFFTDTYRRGRRAVLAWIGIDGVGATAIGAGRTRADAARDALETLALVKRTGSLPKDVAMPTISLINIDDPALIDAVTDVVAELLRARRKFGPFKNGHEGYAVIREELDELWDAVKGNDLPHSMREAVQVAAMAIRYVLDLREYGDLEHGLPPQPKAGSPS